MFQSLGDSSSNIGVGEVLSIRSPFPKVIPASCLAIGLKMIMFRPNSKFSRIFKMRKEIRLWLCRYAGSTTWPKPRKTPERAGNPYSWIFTILSESAASRWVP